MTDKIYQKANAPVFEAIYGKGFISLGGAIAIRNMFKGHTLHGKSILDIGFGLGGLLNLISSENTLEGIGLEIHPWMADYAVKSTPLALQDSLKFHIYNPDTDFPLPNRSVDIAVSKGVLTNIKNKSFLFSETHRVLKPFGKILLIDWLAPESLGQTSSVLSFGDASHKETKSSYRKLLDKCGFSQICFTDVSEEYLHYVEQLDLKYHSRTFKEEFQSIISDNLRNQLIQANQNLLQLIKKGRQLSYKIEASK